MDSRPVLLSDLGNVLVNVDREQSLNVLEQRLEVSRDRLLPFFEDAHQLHRQLEVGAVTPDEFLHKMAAELGQTRPIDINTIRTIYGTSFSRMEDTIQTIDNFRPAIRVILLSNTNAIDIPYIEEEFGLISWADDAILSYQVGMRKPDQDIYEYAMKEYQLNPEHTLFIDDKSENIDAARQAGLKAEIYRSANQVRTLLEDLL